MTGERWNFHIGGYQVLDKYLKSRKGRKLSLDGINHVAAVADGLAFTVEQMTKIDKAYLARVSGPGVIWLARSRSRVRRWCRIRAVFLDRRRG